MFKQRRVVLTMVTAILVVTAAGVSLARANDIAPFQTVYNTDVAVFGLGGMRGLGTGTITVSGVSGTVNTVYLYWHGPTRSADPASNATVTFNGTSVTGTNIGTSSDNCWGFTNSQAYRADVTALMPGNGAYPLANFTKPTAPGAVAEVNGASLVVFYNDGDSTNNRDFVMFDGNDSNTTNAFDAAGWNVSLPGINYTSGATNLSLIVSDGQTFPDSALVLNGTTIAAGPLVFQGDSVPTAGSNNNGFLWDVKSYDITAQMTPGPNTLNLTSDYTSDCLSLIVAGVNLPAGAAPNQPPTTTTTTTTTAPPPTEPPAPDPPVDLGPVAATPVVARPAFTG